MNASHTSISYPPPPLGLKNQYLEGLRYGFEILPFPTKRRVGVWYEQNQYLISDTYEPNDPLDPAAFFPSGKSVNYQILFS